MQKGSERSFGFVFVLVFAIVATWPLLDGGPIRMWAVTVSICIALISIFAPKALKPFNDCWFKIGLLLQAVISPLILGLIFLITVLPTGLVMKLAGKNPLDLKFNPRAKTYWISKDHSQNSSMKNQY